MNAALAIPNDRILAGEIPGHVDMNNLIMELDRYRKQSAWLSLINELHGRLAGALDLPSMVEAFSVWLMPIVEHNLIAYDNTARERRHLFCSCHGPDRRRVMEMADRLFPRLDCRGGEMCWREDGFFVYCWRIPDREGGGRLLLLRQQGAIDAEGIRQIGEGLAVLEEPLQRAVEYENLFDQARRDALTGLANRRVLDERIDSMLESARRHNRPLTIACMDLDRFKQVNDTMGHAEGDRVLRMVARALAGMVRTSDLLVRMGGDEFQLLMPDTSLENARTLADRLCMAVEGLEIQAPGSERLGVSIGLTQWQPDLTKEEWLQRADEALYQAKATGRSRACVG
ncbi:MAG: GGDEF domain-containing protein [Desulfobulbaceae bacterium]|nr:GGDEF domain-containing protein [Desulfobulbaceae bacterium]